MKNTIFFLFISVSIFAQATNGTKTLKDSPLTPDVTTWKDSPAERDALDSKKEKSFILFAKISNVTWQSQALEIIKRYPESKFINGVLLKNTFAGEPVNLQLRDSERSVTGKAIDLGLSYGKSGSRFHGKFFIRGITADTPGSTTYKYSESTLGLLGLFTAQTQNNVFETYSYKPIQRGMIVYDQDILFAPNSPNRFLAGLGFKLGINLQGESLKSQMIPFGSVTTTATASAGSFGSSPTTLQFTAPITPIPSNFSHSEAAVYGTFGLSEKFKISDKHELDLSVNYFQGNGQGRTKRETITILIIPRKSGDVFTYNTNIVGEGLTLGYTWNFSERFALKLSGETRTLRSEMTKTKTRPINSPTAFPDLGPKWTTVDKISFIGIEFQYRF